MHHSLYAGLGLLALTALSACGKPADPTATASTEAVSPAPGSPTPGGPTPDGPAASADASPFIVGEARKQPLSYKLDCLRDRGALLLIGHRGGPTRDYPENALETFQRTLKAGTHGMEIDVVTTKDGVLTLMHDDTLDRTTTGKGAVADTTWAEMKKLSLRTGSKTTTFHPPLLDDVLAWAVANNVVLELDRKPSTELAPIIAAVRKAGAENNVFLITYTDAQAIEAQQLAPELVITATVNSDGHLDFLLSKGVKLDKLVAWTGTEQPDPALWKSLAARNVESAFGTLGPRDRSLDSKYWADGNGQEFSDLVQRDGLPILVADITDKAARQLNSDIAKAAVCGL